MSEPSIPEALADHPASDKLVYRILLEQGPVHRQELVEETYLHIRTVTDCLRRLRDAGVVEKEHDPNDVRKVMYDVDPFTKADESVCYG